MTDVITANRCAAHAAQIIGKLRHEPCPWCEIDKLRVQLDTANKTTFRAVETSIQLAKQRGEFERMAHQALDQRDVLIVACKDAAEAIRMFPHHEPEDAAGKVESFLVPELREAAEACERAVANTPWRNLRQLPSAWMRMARIPSTVDQPPGEFEYECYAGDEPPDDGNKDWIPLYRRARPDEEALDAVPQLKGKNALVLYFETKEDADEIAALIQEAKPGMRAVHI